MNLPKWSCYGNVRGVCGVTHGSYALARKCCERDAQTIRRLHGEGAYSDRAPEPVNREAERLHESEVEAHEQESRS
jgi:hypothetical protein